MNTLVTAQVWESFKLVLGVKETRLRLIVCADGLGLTEQAGESGKDASRDYKGKLES